MRKGGGGRTRSSKIGLAFHLEVCEGIRVACEGSGGGLRALHSCRTVVMPSGHGSKIKVVPEYTNNVTRKMMVLDI